MVTQRSDPIPGVQESLLKTIALPEAFRERVHLRILSRTFDGGDRGTPPVHPANITHDSTYPPSAWTRHAPQHLASHLTWVSVSPRCP